ncbi:MAG: beta-galactosidase trimerization domain-containing protein [Christensenellales bacterium]
MNKYLEKAMRWAQLTICEGDIPHFDPDKWLYYMNDAACDGLVLGSGGYMAFHKTTIPYHYKVKHSQYDDVFRYMVETCRRKGYAIICRTDAHAFHDDAFQAHPEWVAYTHEGKPRRHWSFDEVWVSDVLGDYGFDFMKRVHGELASNYDLDGIFCNRWQGSGICYCDSCAEAFKSAKGFDLPVGYDFDDPAMRAYLDWHEERLLDLCNTWDQEIICNNPNMRYIPNSTVGLGRGLDNKLLGDYSDVLYADRQGRDGLMTPWFNGRNGKELRAVMGKKPIGGIFSTGITERRWKDSVQEKAELELWVSEAVANGLRPWFTKFSVQVFDNRWMLVVKALYNKYKKWEKYLRNIDSCAEVALMLSQHSAKRYAGNRLNELLEKPLNGFYQALIEARIPFDILDSHYITKEYLSKYNVVILPNIAVLSDEDCSALIRYVEEGGAILATYETSLYDEFGNKRKDFALASLFGVTYQGDVVRDVLNSYIQVDSKSESKILLKGFDGDNRIIGTDNRVKIALTANDFESSPFHAVPAYPDLPMEEVYPRNKPADYEEVLFRKQGKGRVVYYCGDIGRSFWDYLTVDHQRLIENSVRWCMNGEAPVTLEGSGLIDITVWRNTEGLSIHLVNMTTVNAMRGPAREIIPVQDLVLHVRNDLAGEASVVFSHENSDLQTKRMDNYITIGIPKLKLHELIVIR